MTRYWLLLVVVLALPAAAPAQTPGSISLSTLDGLLPAPDAQQWTPVTQRERFTFYVETTFSLSTIGGAGVSAALRQRAHQPYEWHQGTAGFSRRFGDSLAKSGVRLTLRYALAAALKEDNRYIASPKTTFRGRLWDAMASTYEARDERGHKRFGFSKFAGNAGGSIIGRYWEPPSWQGGPRVARDFALTSVLQMGYNVASEFTPGLIRRLKH